MVESSCLARVYLIGALFKLGPVTRGFVWRFFRSFEWRPSGLVGKSGMQLQHVVVRIPGPFEVVYF